MAVKVMVTRRMQEGKSMEAFALLNKMRAAAMEQPGFIYGETLIGYDNPREVVILAMWQSVDNWLKWKDNQNRKANEAKLDQCLEGPPEYKVFILGTYPPRK